MEIRDILIVVVLVRVRKINWKVRDVSWGRIEESLGRSRECGGRVCCGIS